MPVICAGVGGAIAATFGVALPSFILIMMVCTCMSRFKESKFMDGAFVGIRPATAGLVAAAVILLAKGMGDSLNVVSTAIIVGTVILVGKVKISPIPIMIGAGLIGAFLCG